MGSRIDRYTSFPTLSVPARLMCADPYFIPHNTSRFYVFWGIKYGSAYINRAGVSEISDPPGHLSLGIDGRGSPLSLRIDDRRPYIPRILNSSETHTEHPQKHSMIREWYCISTINTYRTKLLQTPIREPH